MTKRMRARKLYSEGRSAGPRIDLGSGEYWWAYWLRQAEAALTRHDVGAWLQCRKAADAHLAGTLRSRRQ